jgi:hypothetical protein
MSGPPDRKALNLHSGPTMTVYIEKEIGWPLKMKATMNGENSISVSIDINLVETNIPRL